uniref:Uncharacterized protein n=1 Tax=Rhizobium sp. TAL1145 TaxID=147233 RepID=Q84HW3_9HYPH|nr:unknown [Rhizobium sp. TAL1145]
MQPARCVCRTGPLADYQPIQRVNICRRPMYIDDTTPLRSEPRSAPETAASTRMDGATIYRYNLLRCCALVKTTPILISPPLLLWAGSKAGRQQKHRSTITGAINSFTR